MTFSPGDKVRFTEEAIETDCCPDPLADHYIVRRPFHDEDAEDHKGRQFVYFEGLHGGGWYDYRLELVTCPGQAAIDSTAAVEEYEDTVKGMEILSDILKDQTGT